jgi:hypothetical protein
MAVRDFELRADELGLSVWRLDGNTLEHAIAAVAAERVELDHLDYIAFDPVIIPGIEVAHKPVRAAHVEAGASWHFELNPPDRVRLLAEALWKAKSPAFVRVSKPDVLKLICDAVKRGDIDPAQLKQKLGDKVRAELHR